MKNYVIFALGVVLGIIVEIKLSSFDKNSISYLKSSKADTIYVTEYATLRDTIFVEKPKYYKEVFRDTVPAEMFSSDGKSLVFTQKEYRDSNYVAWVSGVEPQLDSIMVFKDTEYVFKTYTIETVKTIEDKTGNWYTGAGLYRLDDALVPKLNIVYQKKRIIASASIGLYNNHPIYGIDFNFKVK